MKTREDYADMEALAKKIAPDEIVFIIRQHDSAAPAAIQAWINKALADGAEEAILNRAQETRRAILDWQARNGSKVPDLPLELLSEDEKRARYAAQRAQHRIDTEQPPMGARSVGTPRR